MPRSVNAVNVQAHQMTITWKSTKCELDLSRSCEVHLLFDGADSVVEVVRCSLSLGRCSLLFLNDVVIDVCHFFREETSQEAQMD